MNVTMNVKSSACAPRIVKHRISRTKTLHTPFQPLQIQKIDNFTRTGSRTPSRRLHNTWRRDHHFKFSHPGFSQLTSNRRAIVSSAAREEIISPSKRYAVPPKSILSTDEVRWPVDIFCIRFRAAKIAIECKRANICF